MFVISWYTGIYLSFLVLRIVGNFVEVEICWYKQQAFQHVNSLPSSASYSAFWWTILTYF